MGYDEAYVLVRTASEPASSNGLVAKGRIRIHKVVLQGDGSNALSVDLYNALTATGTIQIGVVQHATTGTVFSRLAQSDFDPPVVFDVGLSMTFTGNGGTVRIYYSR